MTRRRPITLIGIATIVLAACGLSVVPSGPSVPPTPASQAPSPRPSVPASPGPTPEPTPAPTVGVVRPWPAALALIPPLDCPGGTTGGDIDHVPGASGADPNLEAATRHVRGVRISDVIALDGARSGIVRDGRGVFAGRWSRSASGGWLLFQYESCVDAGIGVTPPFGLVRDAIAEVLVEHSVVVRSAANSGAQPVSPDAGLRRGDQVFIVDGPVQSGGSAWYLVRALPGGISSGPFGWVAATSPGGEPWIEDRENSTCPTVPRDAPRLGVLPEELLVHCFGPSEVAFELEANVYCLGPDAGPFDPPVEPAWFSPRCGILSGDACGSCDIPTAVDPQFGALPRESHALWSFSGHFDDAAALTCVPASQRVDDLSLASIVHRCRTTFVLTSLVRLGEGSG